MFSFDTLRETLQRHLPRGADGSVVSIGADGLEVREPGVSIGDVALMLQDLTGTDELLPEGLPIAGIRLATLRLARGEGAAGGVELAFTLRWDGATLPVAEGMSLSFDQLSFELHRRTLRARGAAKLQIDGHVFDLSLELPSRVFELVLEPARLASATPLLQARAVVRAGGAPVVREFSLRGSLWFQSVRLHVELDDLYKLGPVTLTDGVADLLLAGEGSVAAAAARLDVALHRGGTLQIDVEGEVDAHGWRLAGALTAPPGTLTLGGLVESFTAGTLPPTVPDAIKGCSLTHLAASIDTHDGSVGLEATLDWPNAATLVVRLDHQAGVLRLAGRLVLAEVAFELAFTSAGTALLMGTFDAAGSKPMTLDAILSALSVPAASALGPQGTGISLGVKGAAVVIDAQKQLLVAVHVDAGIDLTRLGELPLIGSLLPHAEPLGLSIDPYYMSSGFDATQLTLLPALPASISLPDVPTAGAHVAAAVHLGGKPVKLDSLFSAQDGAEQAAAPTVAAAAAAAPAKPGALTWKDVNKSLGPLQIGRIGWAKSTDPSGGTVLDLALDASIALAGLTVSVDGLGARYAFDTRTLTPALRGLGISLQRGPLGVSGAFLNDDGDFSGQVRLATPKFSLSAIGAFTMIDGTPSMFAYGVLDVPLGGPVFFFVEGLAAGFGLHRRLHAPPVDAVRSFPLIAAAGVKPAGKVKPADEQRKLHEYITPQLGEYFLAVGLKFNSFRLLHGCAVLVVSAGEHFEIDVVGTADFVSPPDLPDTVPALARIKLDLIARFVPAQGLIAVEARLDPASYVYGPLCHLSGGFAFYAWMNGDRRGDFVLSVGGYHPAYVKPDHYPVVPRVELSYQVTPEVYLKGYAYFALTPAVMMCGGGLHAQLAAGSLHAWADFSADFWVAWEPFHYDVLVHVGVGASWKCFSTSASADLHLWGPDFSGTAHVDWFVFSFDFAFGPQSAVVPRPIAVAKFMQSFLGVDTTQESQDKTLGIVATGGIVALLGGTVPVVEPAGLVLASSSRVPALAARVGTAAVAVGAPQLGVAPADMAVLDVSEHSIRITRSELDANGNRVDAEVSSHFAAITQDTGVPAALWGQSMKVAHDAPPILAVTGLELRPATPVQPGPGVDTRVQDLAYDSPQVRAPRRVFTAHQRVNPLVEATTLPGADLAALGLDASALRWVAPPAGRARIDMLTGDLEAAHG